MVGNSPFYDPFAMARIAALLPPKPLSFCTGQLSETGERWSVSDGQKGFMESKMTYSDNVKPYQERKHCTDIMRRYEIDVSKNVYCSCMKPADIPCL